RRQTNLVTAAIRPRLFRQVQRAALPSGQSRQLHWHSSPEHRSAWPHGPPHPPLSPPPPNDKDKLPGPPPKPSCRAKPGGRPRSPSSVCYAPLPVKTSITCSG